MKDFFNDLTPEKILTCAESTGLGRATGRIYQLNSMENRVYEVELEDGIVVVGKFYRAGRWGQAALQEEHDFLHELILAEVPAVAPLELSQKTLDASNKEGIKILSPTLGQTSDGLFYTIFPKVRGRAPDELSITQAQQLGRLVARMHAVGKTRSAPNRLKMTPENFGQKPLDFLLQGKWIAIELQSRYEDTVNRIIEKITPLFEDIQSQRIHGDCHLGNLLFDLGAPKNAEGNFPAFFLDFDDMVEGPPVQDIWLATPEPETREAFLEGYESMNDFDRSTLQLIGPLRALRIINYSAWIARRWEDPFFQRIFTEFKSFSYWANEMENLELISRQILI